MVNIYGSFIRKWIDSMVFRKSECLSLIHNRIESIWHFNRMKIICVQNSKFFPFTSSIFFLFDEHERMFKGRLKKKYDIANMFRNSSGIKVIGSQITYYEWNEYGNRKHKRCAHKTFIGNVYFACFYVRSVKISNVCFRKTLMFCVSIPLKFA